MLVDMWEDRVHPDQAIEELSGLPGSVSLGPGVWRAGFAGLVSTVCKLTRKFQVLYANGFSGSIAV